MKFAATISKHQLPLLTTLLLCLAMLLHGPITQLAHYHEFIDTRQFAGLPNFADVLSNIGFVIAGMWGLLQLGPHRRHAEIAAAWPGYCLFMLALVLTAAGSSYYHLAPDNMRLAWDRLPIALACVGLLIGVRAENGSAINARRWIVPGMSAAVSSVVWWQLTEQMGQGDLRFYLLLQMLPLILIPMWHSLHHAPGETRLAFGAAMIFYVIAKVAELNDHAIFTTFGWISGHTLKHLLASLAAWVIVSHLVKRVR